MANAETILIIDDTPANLSVLVDCLGDAGYRLMVADDGEEALTQVAQSRPDLILLDVMMPGLDGYATLERLKSNPGTADIPVIFMTALAETSEKVRAFAAGAVDYITKPIQHEEALARVRTHLTLQRLRRELADELAVKERFLRIAGHDLRNPLCLVLVALGTSRRLQGVTPEMADQLDEIHASALQMRRIIDTFLNIRRPADEGAAIGPIDVQMLATAVVQQQRSSAERKQIGLFAEENEGVPLARGDSALIYQALANYVSNAVKFTPPGGRVTVRCRRQENRVRTEVIDSGPGVPAAERERLFREYERLSPRPTGGEESNGLGLSIVRQLVASLGGQVGAEFPADGGSIFWFELPAAPGPKL